MTYDKDSFLAGLAVGRMLWRPPLVFSRSLIARIEVTTPPAKLSYSDGEAIDYSGMVVTGYSAAGIALCELPLSELTVTDKAELGDAYQATSDLTNTIPMPYLCAKSIKVVTTNYTTYKTALSSDGWIIGWRPWLSDLRNYGHYMRAAPTQPDPSVYAWSHTYLGKTVYYGELDSSESSSIVEMSPMTYDGATVNFGNQWKVAWTMIYGAKSSTQTVTVSYTTPQGAVLTDSFEITVTA